MNILKIEDLRKDYDESQVKYGAKELDSIYNGGCEKNPDICFVFMNPTGKNIASDKSWKGRKSPWLGTKNIWKLFYKVDLLSKEINIIKPKIIITFGNQVSSIILNKKISENSKYTTLISYKPIFSYKNTNFNVESTCLFSPASLLHTL